ncbi:putative oxidoreductase [Pseudolycoriella hygida]|uniref:Oxidoreductase n=1 Tax=Pseudolycoriella hygida TaxID=35572 RepID=A0A9Q0S2I1_9DIPT|nr:putative oxidoreductase [Pseudolycoriella hygida]
MIGYGNTLISTLNETNSLIQSSMIHSSFPALGLRALQFFAKEEASLALVGRNAERFQKVTAKIKEANMKIDPLVILADISVDGEAERIISETLHKFDHLDILINNAGFVIPGSIETTKIADFDLIMGTNVRGTLILTQMAIPHLIATKGNVVNVSSVAGLRQFENLLAYNMSKAALDQFTRCVALELTGKGVRVNSVNPAAIDTNPRENLGLDQENTPEQVAAMEAYGKLHPIGRVGRLYMLLQRWQVTMRAT